MLLKKKLSDNANHFPTKASKIHYILSKINRPATNNLLPFIQKIYKQPAIFQTSQQILNHLKTYYRNPNAHNKAHEKYKKLSISNNALFQTFKLKFVKLAKQADIPRKKYKRDLNNKIPSRLNERVVKKLYNDGINFEQFCHVLIQYNNQQHKNFIKKKKQQPPQKQRGR